MTLRVCSQPDVAGELPQAFCIDGSRLRDVGVVSIPNRPRPTRDGCHCLPSVDIGEYDTCPHGCAYCYANRDRETAIENLRRHDPAGESLYGGVTALPPIAEPQGSLF